MFEVGTEYIVKATDKGLEIIDEFDRDRYIDIEHDDIDVLTDKEKENIILACKAEYKPPVGEWIGHGEHCRQLGVMPSGLGTYEWCSNCDCAIDVRDFHKVEHNYCPRCGAKMEVYYD